MRISYAASILSLSPIVAYHPARHHRLSIRLRGYDYTIPGAYFVTIVAYRRIRRFGEVVDGVMRLSLEGEIALAGWRAIPVHFPRVRLDTMVVMPDHVHGVLWIIDDMGGDGVGRGGGRVGPDVDLVGAQHAAPLQQQPSRRYVVFPRRGAPPRPVVPSPPDPRVIPGSIGAIVRSYKSAVTRSIHSAGVAWGKPVWQRNYHEHVVRSRADLERIRRYIEENPIRLAREMGLGT